MACQSHHHQDAGSPLSCHDLCGWADTARAGDLYQSLAGTRDCAEESTRGPRWGSLSNRAENVKVRILISPQYRVCLARSSLRGGRKPLSREKYYNKRDCSEHTGLPPTDVYRIVRVLTFEPG